MGSWVPILGSGLVSRYKLLKIICKILHICIYVHSSREKIHSFPHILKRFQHPEKVKNWSSPCPLVCTFTVTYRWEKLTCWRWHSYQMVGCLTAKPGLFCMALSYLSCIIFVDHSWALFKYIIIIYIYIILSNFKVSFLRHFPKFPVKYALT